LEFFTEVLVVLFCEFFFFYLFAHEVVALIFSSRFTSSIRSMSHSVGSSWWDHFILFSCCWVCFRTVFVPQFMLLNISGWCFCRPISTYPPSSAGPIMQSFFVVSLIIACCM